ncbi:hypothetical protein HYPSUDRAFT_197932 [Hypholoma sublateritium FD-334 SS-4]|uniref:DUF7082 domain-containing protein n=1 Tax=Hypholoma sublateritium (strain FD-334 SS-4) TaxID=945553 RepID=A0A0D2LJE4_HYPSF|nr:hypothetical protein HYPSUDRAFT_197932 [Hypholoma sublateritium FD-334 SS-4]
MASSDPPPIVSPTGIIHVLGYTPTEGERGVPITVRIHFHPDLADAMYVRLVVGNKAVPTKVRQLPAVTYGRWQLYAAAPPFDRAAGSTKVLIAVQALNKDNDILDSVTFGEFSYWAPGERRSSDAAAKLPRLQIPDGPSLRRRSVNHISPTADRSHFPSSPQQRKTRLHRRAKSQSLVRTKHQPGADAQEYAQTPQLDMLTPLASICADWAPAEVAAGRRLVRFTKIQDGRRLIVSCEPIPQDQFREADSVISCIHRAENGACYVTSVDVIYLLERLTNGEFPVEEKNRIRRNLEGLRPTTVSKHKPGFGDFFQRIMEFPDPKPRNIEKDLKVFDWNLLGQALEKILSKYSIYTSAPDPDEAPAPAESTPPSSASASAEDSPELFALQLAYPPPDDAAASRFLDVAAGARAARSAKFEPFADDFALGAHPAHHHADPPFGASPVDSVLTAASSSSASSSAAFPLFAPHEPLTGGADAHAPTHAHAHGEYHPWGGSGSAFKSESLPLESYGLLGGAYEPAGGGAHPFGDPALDFDLYDTYSFPGLLTDDALGLGEQHQYI